VSGIEEAIGARYTYDTLRYLIARCPGVRFVWIMGADNLRSFHRWQNWRDIAALVPIAVVDRLGPSLYAMGSTAAQALGRYRLAERNATLLADHAPPAWVFLHGLKSPLSSTALRAARQSRKSH
jgi:nicotinate-nucleotide adenylyltransferase